MKTLEDFKDITPPVKVEFSHDEPTCPFESQMILRMLVRPKYGQFQIPLELNWLSEIIKDLASFDEDYTGIRNSWCYVTVRHGIVTSKTDDEWHFDGASFRVELSPERNYLWVNHTPTEYKVGTIDWPADFDPLKHNLFTFAANALKDVPAQSSQAKQWYVIDPFCLHRRPTNPPNISRTFIRISFTDIEGRDVNNTLNPLIDTDAYGRDPVKSFRNKLTNYVSK